MWIFNQALIVNHLHETIRYYNISYKIKQEISYFEEINFTLYLVLSPTQKLTILSFSWPQISDNIVIFN